MRSFSRYGAVAVLSLIITVATCAACLDYPATSGPPVTKEYNYNDFSNVEIGSFFGGLDADVTASDSYGVSITMPENLVKYLEVSEANHTLKITLDRILYASDRPRVLIQMPDLRRVNYSAGSKGRASGFKSAHDMSILCSGGGILDLDVEAGSTDINLSGGGRVTGRAVYTDARLVVSGGGNMELTGMGSGITRLDASGGSQVNLSGLTVRNADVTLSGGSQADMSVNEELSVNLSGGSGLRYKGSPEITKQILTGFSELTHD